VIHCEIEIQDLNLQTKIEVDRNVVAKMVI